MTLELSVVVPCYNEAKNLPELVIRLLNVFSKKNLAGEVVLVNDGSRDNTGEVINGLSAEYSNVTGTNHDTNSGIVAAWRTGLALARGKYVVFIDADLQNLPEDIWRLYREITISKSDMVQGYRSTVGREKGSRFYLSIGLNAILNNLFGMHQRDNKSGFVIALKETLEDILRYRYHYYYFQTFIAVSAHAKGYSIREIETLFEGRLLGQSFMTVFPVKVIFLALIDIFKAFIEFRLLPKHDGIITQFLATHSPQRHDEPLTGFRKFLFEFYWFTAPLHMWMITRRAKVYYEELKESQWLSGQTIKELQERKLRRLIRHAYYHVGFWRQTFDENGLTPDDINTIEDLAKIPLLSKTAVRENLYFDMLSDNHNKKKILRISTSGSTGEPFVCFADQHQLEIRWAATLRCVEWTGYRFGDRCARLWHQTLGMTPVQVAREAFDAWLTKRVFVPAFALSDGNMKSFIEKMKRHQPVLLDGYAESFNFLAAYVKSHGITGLRPKAIISSAQVLPEQTRKIIEDAFGCKVFDKYGSREFSGIAYECEAHEGHHIVAETYIVEVLKDGQPAQPGEMGEVVVTDLNNFCMPLIRYRVGDLVMAMDNNIPCPCGRGLPRIGEIEGRTQAIVFGTNGTYMPSSFFYHVIKDYDHVLKQYQVVQDKLGAISLKIVKAPRFDDEQFKEVIAVLHKYLGHDLKIDVEYVDHIALGRTGKHQAVISNVRKDFQEISDGQDGTLTPLTASSSEKNTDQSA